MPPQCKFTRDEIVREALELTREKGISAVTARGLAARLGSSAKPIFSLFESMEQVQGAVMEAAHRLYQQRVQEEMERKTYPPYKAAGMAYTHFAKQEKELFRLLFMRDRSRESVGEQREEVKPLLRLIQERTGLDEKTAYRLHLEMWIYVHGIATMLATSYLEWDEDFISQVLTDAYVGLQCRYAKAGEGNESGAGR